MTPRTNLKRFADGGFYVWRLSSQGFRRKDGGGKKLPYYRHPTLQEAEAEASRLSAEFPGSTFVILQEVARAKATGGAR